MLLVLLSALFVSCKKDYEIPPIQALPMGDSLTIADLLAMPTGSTFTEASVFGVVTADEKSGNLYKTIFIQDRQTGKAIELLMNTSSGARIGDEVRVYLDKDMFVNDYHNLPQLTGKDGKGFNPDGHLIIYPKNKPIEPTVVTIADIKTGSYTAGLVKLENVEFADQGSAFCNIGETTNRTLRDDTGEIIVRTSNYANFAYDLMPAGRGSLVAIASVYNNDWQLIIRSKTEMKFEGGTPTPPAPAGEVQHLPYTQSFSSDFGTYMTYDVLGDQSWVIDYSTAKMTGYVKPDYFANEDWLISSPVDLTGVTEAKITMSYIGRYFTNINEEVTIWASTDYVYGNDPTTATWEMIPARLTEGSDWNNFLTAEIAVANANGMPLVGQNTTFAVKYTSTDGKAGTIEIKSITISEGGVTPGPTPPGPGTLTGDGTRENPYTAQDVITLNIQTSDGNKYWVKDYIVGYVDANYNYQFTADLAVNTNLTLSSNVNASADSECIPVQLPVGAVRQGLNLVDNPGNLGQEVLLYGTLEKYFKVAAVKNVTYAEINGNNYGVDPGYIPPTPTGEVHDLPYEQSFETEFGTYITYDVTGDQKWVIDYSSAKMTGYEKPNSYLNEDWLISEPFNVPVTATPKMTVNYIGCYFVANEVDYINEDVTFWISSNYTFGNAPETAAWYQVPVTLTNSANFNAGFKDVEADLAVQGLVLGETATVAVRYLSSTERAGTIEIKKITIEEGSGVTPEPPTPVQTITVAEALQLQGSEDTFWVQGYIVGAVKKSKMATSNDNIDWEAPFSWERSVLIADNIQERDLANCVVVELPADTQLRTLVNLKDHPENFGGQLTVKGRLDAYLSHEGVKDCPGTEQDFILDLPR